MGGGGGSLGQLLNTATLGLVGESPKDAALKAQRNAEADRLKEAEAIRAEEEQKRKKRIAERAPTDVILAGEGDGGAGLGQ